MQISLIVAMGHSRQIGIDGRIPWHLPSDLQNFKKLTMGHTLIFGRKTFESIGRPLPGRKTIVLTRDSKFNAPACIVASNIKDALLLARKAGESEVFIAGGAQIYEEALDHVNRMYLSLVDYDGEADTYFPEYSTEGWERENTQEFAETAKEPAWSFTIWKK